jgi:hypothetical protein
MRILLIFLLSTQPAFGQGTPTFDRIVGNAKTLNQIQYADQQRGDTADAQIGAAEAALPSGGGIVDARGYGCTTQTIANQLLVGSSSKQVTLLLDRCTVYNITVAGGVDAIQVYNDSSIKAVEGSNPLNTSSGFALAPSANLKNAISCQPANSQNTCNLENITIKGISGARVSNAMLSLTGITDISTFRNILIWNFYNTVGLKILATTGVPVGPVNFENLSVNGGGNPGARPVQIYEGTSCRNCGIYGVNFIGGTLVHPGPGGLPIVDIDGQGVAGALSGVNFFGTYIEPINSSDIGFKIRDAANIVLSGVSTAGVAAADMVNLSQSVAGYTHGIKLLGIRQNGNWANTVNDTINSRLYTNGTIPDFSFGDTSYTTNFGFQETAPPRATTGIDLCYGDSMTHAQKCSYNNGPYYRQTQTVASGTAAMTTAAISAGKCGTTVTIAATGVSSMDTVTWAFNAPPGGTNAGLVAWPTSGTVNFAYCPGSAETPAPATINFRVTR